MKPVMNNMSVVVSRVLQSVMRYFNPFMRLVLASRAHPIGANTPFAGRGEAPWPVLVGPTDRLETTVVLAGAVQ